MKMAWWNCDKKWSSLCCFCKSPYIFRIWNAGIYEVFGILLDFQSVYLDCFLENSFTTGTSTVEKEWK